MSFSLQSAGSFKGTEAWLHKVSNFDPRSILETYGKAGVDALRSVTPVETGRAQGEWFYRVIKTGSGWDLEWHNSDVESGFPVALRLQLGYATGTGGYVQGRDYINPAIRPIFDKIGQEAQKAVTSV